MKENRVKSRDSPAAAAAAHCGMLLLRWRRPRPHIASVRHSFVGPKIDLSVLLLLLLPGASSRRNNQSTVLLKTTRTRLRERYSEYHILVTTIYQMSLRRTITPDHYFAHGDRKKPLVAAGGNFCRGGVPGCKMAATDVLTPSQTQTCTDRCKMNRLMIHKLLQFSLNSFQILGFTHFYNTRQPASGPTHITENSDIENVKENMKLAAPKEGVSSSVMATPSSALLSRSADPVCVFFARVHFMTVHFDC